MTVQRRIRFTAGVNRETLHTLSKDDLVTLILAQQAQIEDLSAQVRRLSARITDLEARLDAPARTPDNSGIPPSKGQKPDLPERPRKPSCGRPGTCRALAANPDRVIEATLTTCPHCAHALSPANQPLVHAWDHIDLPPIRPIVTRINRHRGVCPCCRRRVAAPAPQGFEPGSPFGPGLRALILHLHVTQAIGFERLARQGRRGAGAERREHPGTHRRGRPREGQGPGRGVLVVECVPQVGIVHPGHVVERKSEPAQAQAVKLLKDGMLLGRGDPVQPRDLQGDGLDGRPVQPGQDLRGQGLLQAHHEDGRLA